MASIHGRSSWDPSPTHMMRRFHPRGDPFVGGWDTNQLTHTITHTLRHSPTHSHTHLTTHPLSHSRIQLLNCSFSQSLTLIERCDLFPRTVKLKTEGLGQKIVSPFFVPVGSLGLNFPNFLLVENRSEKYIWIHRFVLVKKVIERIIALESQVLQIF